MNQVQKMFLLVQCKKNKKCFDKQIQFVDE